MLVQNVDYPSLVEDEQLLADFKYACVTGILEQIDTQGILREHIEATVKQGSVLVEAVINVPEDVEADTVVSSLEAFEPAAVVQHIETVPRIEVASTGAIVVLVTTTTTTTAGLLGEEQPDEDLSMSSVFVRSALIVMGCICLCGVFGAFISLFIRKKFPQEAPIEVFGELSSSPKHSDSLVSGPAYRQHGSNAYHISAAANSPGGSSASITSINDPLASATSSGHVVPGNVEGGGAQQSPLRNLGEASIGFDRQTPEVQPPNTAQSSHSSSTRESRGHTRMDDRGNVFHLPRD
jgi:hypothetical protein